MVAGLSDFYPVLPIFFVISLVLLILPIWGFIRGRNTAVLFYIAWLFLGNAIYYVNMLVWRGSVIDYAPVYCDIISVLIVMLPMGISCSLLCINMLVWKISKSTTLLVHHTRQRVVIDSVICIGVPFAYAGLHVLVQGKRFTIVEDVGCMPATDHTLPSLFVYYLPPSIICCCVTFIFSVLSIRNFYRTRYRTNSLLPEHASHAMSFNRYLRLILLCTTSFLLIAVFLISMVAKSIQIGFLPISSWANNTWDFGHVDILSRIDLETIPHRKTMVFLQLTPLPVLSFHFFLFFGIGSEAMKVYRGAFSAPADLLRGWRSQNSKEVEDTQMPSVGNTRIPEWHLRGPSPIPFNIPPPIHVPPPFFPRHQLLAVNDRHCSSVTNPSSAYLVPSPSAASSRSSRSSRSISAGHFPYPPPHFFHEHPYALYSHRPRDSAQVNTGINTHAVDVEAGLDLNTGSTRSRFSVYSDAMGSPVQERRFTRVFTWGRRPNNSI